MRAPFGGAEEVLDPTCCLGCCGCVGCGVLLAGLGLLSAILIIVAVRV